MVEEILRKAIEAALVDEGVEDAEPVALERPAIRDQGDFSSNVALIWAKRLGRSPRELALTIAAKLEGADLPHVSAIVDRVREARHLLDSGARALVLV